VSLTEVIAWLDQGESVKFERSAMSVIFLAKKGDNEISRMLDTRDIDQAKIDLLAFELRRAFDILRRSETTDAN
jgi:hypothetical protein